MKIIFVVPELYNCGPVNVVLNLVKVLHRENEIRVVSLKKSNRNSMVSEFLEYCKMGVMEDITKLSNNNLINYFKGFDIVHSHGYYPDKIVGSMELNAKKISTIHCMFYKDYPKEYGYVKGFFGAYLHYNVFRKNTFSAVICCSDSVKINFLKHVNISNIYSINNGVDHTKFNRSSIVNVDLKKDLNLVEFKRIFVYSGRLIRRKCVPELIEYFNEKSSPSDVLLILGEGPELSLCKKKAIDKKNIIFLGNVSDPEEYYKISDFVISMSSAEGYPMSIVEAVSSGCFALLSNNESHIEFVEKNQAVSCILDKKSKIPVNTAATNNIYQLSADFMASKYLNIYKSS